MQGLDWHGPSTQEAWGSLEALHRILHARDEWREWGFAAESRVLLMGHSNGGQGAWYMAARYPDRVVGGTYPRWYGRSRVDIINCIVVPAAGYIKIGRAHV